MKKILFLLFCFLFSQLSYAEKDEYYFFYAPVFLKTNSNSLIISYETINENQYSLVVKTSEEIAHLQSVQVRSGDKVIENKCEIGNDSGNYTCRLVFPFVATFPKKYDIQLTMTSGKKQNFELTQSLNPVRASVIVGLDAKP
jgi:hypothetical protein